MHRTIVVKDVHFCLCGGGATNSIVDEEGWLHTGDIVMLDRLKDTIQGISGRSPELNRYRSCIICKCSFTNRVGDFYFSL